MPIRSTVVANSCSGEASLPRDLKGSRTRCVGGELTPSQRAKLIAKRKAAYEAVHPETKQGGRPGKAGGGKAKAANLAGFATDTASKTGKPLRTIERDITRSRKLAIWTGSPGRRRTRVPNWTPWLPCPPQSAPR